MKREPDGLTRKELEFRAMLKDGPKYALWARRVREQWEREHIPGVSAIPPAFQARPGAPVQGLTGEKPRRQ